MAKPGIIAPKRKVTSSARPKASRRQRLLAVTAVAVLIVVALVAVQLNMSRAPEKKKTTDDGTVKPPQTGDWIIDKEVIVDKGDLKVDGNLTIKPTGRLHLRNTTLKLSCMDGQGLTVMPGGQLHVSNSVVTYLVSQGACNIVAMEDTTVEMKDSQVALALFIHANKTVVERCTFSGKFTGIMVYSSQNKLTANTVTGADDPVLENAIYLTNNTKNLVSDNKLSGFGSGLTLLRSSSNTIRNNTITSSVGGAGRSGAGIQMYSSENNVLTYNEIKNCEIGLNLVDNSTGNSIHHNNFVGNTRQAADTEANIFDDGGSGNYWSTYLGFDLNKDGKGDLPYMIDLDSIDEHPFMTPVKRP